MNDCKYKEENEFRFGEGLLAVGIGTEFPAIIIARSSIKHEVNSQYEGNPEGVDLNDANGKIVLRFTSELGLDALVASLEDCRKRWFPKMTTEEAMAECRRRTNGVAAENLKEGEAVLQLPCGQVASAQRVGEQDGD